MGLFDNTWINVDTTLVRVGNPAMVVTLRNGLILMKTAPPFDDLDRVMLEMCFERSMPREIGARVYSDIVKPPRRADDRIIPGHYFPPVGIDWQALRDKVNRWEDGTAWKDLEDWED